MDRYIEKNALSATEVRRRLTALANHLQDRVANWKYPSAKVLEQEEANEEASNARRYASFERHLTVELVRNDIDSVQAWLQFRYPGVHARLEKIIADLDEIIPLSPQFPEMELDQVAAYLATKAFEVRTIARQIPRKATVQGKQAELRSREFQAGGRSTQEVFEHLLCEFRREFGSRNPSTIILQLFDEKALKLEQELHPQSIIYCGATVLEQKLSPMGENWSPRCDSFQVVCIPFDDQRNEKYLGTVRADWNAFSMLSQQAGAHLPGMMRDAMSACCEQPLAAWLNLMFWTLRSGIRLDDAYVDRCNLTHIPFSDAADVIEQCKLNTSEPILPPLLQARKDRIDAIPKAPQNLSICKADPIDVEINLPPKMTVERANEEAKKLAESDPNFVKGTIREWADSVGCSPGTIQKTELWRLTMELSNRGRKDKPLAPQTVTITEELEAVLGTGEQHQVLKDLISEQEADHEASPLDSDGRNPKIYR